MKSLFNIFRKNKKTYENIFIHVPKTGGSSFVGLLQETTNEHTAIKTHLVDQIQQTKIIHIDFKQINRTIKLCANFRQR